MEKPDRTSTLLIPPRPACERGKIGYKPTIRVRHDEEALQIGMELEKVFFVGGKKL